MWNVKLLLFVKFTRRYIRYIRWYRICMACTNACWFEQWANRWFKLKYMRWNSHLFLVALFFKAFFCRIGLANKSACAFVCDDDDQQFNPIVWLNLQMTSIVVCGNEMTRLREGTHSQCICFLHISARLECQENRSVCVYSLCVLIIFCFQFKNCIDLIEMFCFHPLCQLISKNSFKVLQFLLFSAVPILNINFWQFIFYFILFFFLYKLIIKDRVWSATIKTIDWIAIKSLCM